MQHHEYKQNQNANSFLYSKNDPKNHKYLIYIYIYKQQKRTSKTIKHTVLIAKIRQTHQKTQIHGTKAKKLKRFPFFQYVSFPSLHYFLAFLLI